MADPIREAQELAEVMEQVTEEMRRFGGVSQETARALEAGSFRRAKELQEAGNKTGTALKHVADAGMAAGKAMLDGKKGATAFNESLDGLAKAAGAASAALMLLGGPIGKLGGLILGAITAVTKYTQAANEMADKLYKGYSGLAKSGAAASDGMTGVFEDAKKLGLSMNELDGLVSTIAANAQGMAGFAGNVQEGRKRLADLGKALEPSREQFIKLGMDMNELADATASYMRLQAMTGRVNRQTSEELAVSTKKYLFEQDALTKLTGMTRKEQESAREEIRAQERFAAQLEELRQQGRDDEAAALEETFLILRSKSKEAAQGFADISTGNLQTEAAQKAYRATQGEALRAADQVKKGQIDAAQAAQRTARAYGETATRLGPTLGKIGAFEDSMGSLDGAIKLRGLAEADVVAQQKKIREDRAKQIGEDGKTADKMLEQQGRLRTTQINANEAMERFVKAGIGPAQEAMITLAKATTAGTDSLNKLFGITPRSDADMQRSEELGEELNKNSQQLEKLQKDLSAAKESGNTAEVKRLQDKVKQAEDARFALERGKRTAESGVSGAGTMDGFEMRSGGSLEAAGRLIEDFGQGTPAVLHGREGVITEDQLRKFGGAAIDFGRSMTTDQTKSAQGQPAGVNTQRLQSGSAESMKIMTNIVRDLNQTLLDKQQFSDQELNQQRDILATTKKISDDIDQQRLVIDKDSDNVDTFVDRRKRLYDSILEAIEKQKEITQKITATAPTTAPSAAPGGTAAPSASTTAATPTAAPSPTSGQPELTGMPTGGEAPPEINAKDYVKFTGGTGSAGHFERLADNVESAFLLMARDYNALTGGKTLQVNSAFRSVEEQANVDSGTNPRAAPGMSLHNVGRALDIQSAQRNELEQLGLLTKYGFRPLAGDPPHISMRDGGIAHGPDTGYPAELHGTEAVIPLKDGAVPVSMPGRFMDLMSRFQSFADMSSSRDDLVDVQTSLGQNFVAELENMRSQTTTPGSDTSDMLGALKQMTDEIKRQGDSNRQVMDAMLTSVADPGSRQLLADLVKEQRAANDISKKILQTSQ